jgi:putative NADH-flavin reductase
LVLGATGDTGKPLIRQALKLGYSVTAVVRNPIKLSIVHENLCVVSGDIFNSEVLVSHMKGKYAVISVLGFPKEIDGPTNQFTDSMQVILNAMKVAQIKLIITISAWYTDPYARVGQFMFDKQWSKVPGLINTLNNEGEIELLLNQTREDAVDFTVVRVPTLTWDPPTGRDFITADGKYWVEGGSGFLPREDVARFMLCTLDDRQKWSRKSVAIAIM